MLDEGFYGKVYVVKSHKGDFLYAAKWCFYENRLFYINLTIQQFSNFIVSIFILTEYYINGSLKIILDKEKSSIADENWSHIEKYICLLGIADAMRYLRKKGVIHRDLKPQNIFIDKDYYLHVCD